MKDSFLIYGIGKWAGLCAFFAAVAYCFVQILQLYNRVSYPQDEVWIYTTSLCIVVPFLVEMHVLHYFASKPKKFFTHIAVSFAILYAMFVTANYVVQLATVIPSTLADKLDEVRILQQTPHSMFWNYDAIGYICMGLSMLAAVPAIDAKGFSRWVRISFIANAAVTPLISVVYFYPQYSYQLLVLGFPWAITAPVAMLMPAILFHHRRKAINSGQLNPAPSPGPATKNADI